MRVLCTVLMPVYNSQKYLETAILSILNQSFSNFEFLIINDCSSDKSIDIIKSFSIDQRIKIIENVSNIGVTKSLIRGLKAANGKYVARMDADDLSARDRLEKQINYLENNTATVAVGCWNEVINHKNEKIDLWANHYSDEEMFYLLHFRNCLTHSSVMFRKEEVMKVGGYDSKHLYAQDYGLWHKLAKVGKIHLMQETLHSLRLSSGSVSSKYKDKQKEIVYQIVSESLKSLGCLMTDDELISIQSEKLVGTANINTVDKLISVNRSIMRKNYSLIKSLGLNPNNIKEAMIRLTGKLYDSALIRCPKWKRVILAPIILNKRYAISEGLT